MTSMKELAGHSFGNVFFGSLCNSCRGTGFVAVSSASTPGMEGYSSMSTTVKCPSCINGHLLKQVSIDQFLDALVNELYSRLVLRMSSELLTGLTPKVAKELTTSHRAHFFDQFVKEVEDRIKNVETQIMDAAKRVVVMPSKGDEVTVESGGMLWRGVVQAVLRDLDEKVVSYHVIPRDPNLSQPQYVRPERIAGIHKPKHWNTGERVFVRNTPGSSGALLGTVRGAETGPNNTNYRVKLTIDMDDGHIIEKYADEVDPAEEKKDDIKF